MHDTSRTANLLGATALAVSDLLLGNATRAAGVSASGASALVVLAHAPDLSVTELGRRIGLTQSASARMVDALEADWLLRRGPGAGRQVSVRLTPAGRRAVRTVLSARGGPLADVLDGLGERERETLDGRLAALLTRLYGTIGDAERICRLCDRASCVTGAVCPVGEAERHAR